MNGLDDQSYPDADDLDDQNYHDVADDRGQTNELDDQIGHSNYDADDLDDQNCHDAADDLGQNFLPGDQNCLGAGDLTGLADHFYQHLLDGRGGYLLQTGVQGDQCAHHLPVEVCDLMKNQNRRVAWHLDAIADISQLDVKRTDTIW